MLRFSPAWTRKLGYLVIPLVVAVVLVSAVLVKSLGAIYDELNCGYDPSYNEKVFADDPQNYFSLISASDTGAAISTPNPVASAVGCEVLNEGGTAADALVASQYALGLVEPYASGPGGGALVMYADRTGKVESWDATAYAPLGDDGARKDPSIIRSVGVPQTDVLLRDLKAEHGSGSLNYQDLVAPAARLARDGFEVTPRLAESIEQYSALFQSPTAAATQLVTTEEGKLATVGDTLRNPAYADYVESVAKGVDKRKTWDVAEGNEARSLQQQVSSQTQLDAVLAGWQETQSQSIKPVEPLCVDYHEHEVCGSPNTANGMMVVAETLGIARHLDLGSLEPYAPESPAPVMRATAAHRLAEAQKQSFADAHAYRTDPATHPDGARAYVDQIVTNEKLLADSAREIEDKKVEKDLEPHKLKGHSSAYDPRVEEGTSQITVRDRYGNTASMTTTLGHHFGSGVVAHGFFLNDSLNNFSSSEHKGDFNARVPGAHPRTTMAPVIVKNPEGEVTAALGSPGGSFIPAYVLKTLVALIDWRLSPSQAVLMPNVGATNKDGMFLEEGPLYDAFPETEKELSKADDLLQGWGHHIDRGTFNSGLGVISGEQAAADPRRHGLVLTSPTAQQFAF
ncbi:gamma-glutamyltransferase [Corynebacterium tapiri]|uniref:Gamma-glutamyltransferase n=1 Tax=Corynebacterium tapiri TaxID=1448266 RepID=A0A5C4U433_9CORY|nr:gamma-glutamyltransferase [Corynebacterium tapiri]TNL96643.1 hypothetical protein FHE74_08065 [Corynebacterium tapiri]